MHYFERNAVVNAHRRGAHFNEDIIQSFYEGIKRNANKTFGIEKLAQFDREVIPERHMHAEGSGAHGTCAVTHDTSRYTKAKNFADVGKQTPMFNRFSTDAGECVAGSSP